MRISILYSILFLLVNHVFFACAQAEDHEKINGISMVASRSTINEAQATALEELGTNFVAVMPYAFMPENQKPQLIFDTKRQWSGETLEGIEADVKTLQTQGLQVMIKPHIWVGSGVFTGEITMSSEEDWSEFEENYKNYIMTFAKLSERNKVAIFCLGTELQEFVSKRPEFWNELIEEVRAIYSGKLTYAENWDSYTTVKFWRSLDFIGIDAYFPISESKTPSLEQTVLAWKTLSKDLEAFSKTHETPILFTEYGYRSIDFAGKEPWDSSRSENPSNEIAQLNLLTGLHQNLWDKDWFAGGFLWKWFPFYNKNSDRHQNRFMIQGKIAEDYLSSFFNRPKAHKSNLSEGN